MFRQGRKLIDLCEKCVGKFNDNYEATFTVPKIIDPVFAKTSPKRSFCMTENERFGLVFVKTGSINSGTGSFEEMLRSIHRSFTAVSVENTK